MSFDSYPDFSWSASRHQQLQECARRYFWDKYGYWEGWDEDAAPDAWLAYRLKKLTNLDFVVGNAIHRRAYELTERAREGRDLPPADVLRQRSRRELKEIYGADRDAFVRDPKYHPMLHGFYYRAGPEEKAIERVRNKLNQCLPHLRALDLWEKIQAWKVRVPFVSNPDERPEPTIEVQSTGVYANPDLVLQEAAEGTYTVVDWKTGQPRERHERQIAVYGLFVRERFEVVECRGRIVYLIDGSSRIVDLTPEVFEETEAWIADSVEQMRGYVADPEVNQPKPKSAFPLTQDRWECKWCNFFELCEEELRAEGPLPWE